MRIKKEQKSQSKQYLLEIEVIFDDGVEHAITACERGFHTVIQGTTSTPYRHESYSLPGLLCNISPSFK